MGNSSWLLSLSIFAMSSAVFADTGNGNQGANYHVFTGGNKAACESIARYASNEPGDYSIIRPIGSFKKSMSAIRWEEVHYDIDMNKDGRSEYVVVVSPYMGGFLHSGEVLIGHAKDELVRFDIYGKPTKDEGGYPGKAPVSHPVTRYTLNPKLGPYSESEPSASELFFDDTRVELVGVLDEVYLVQFEMKKGRSICGGKDDCMALYGLGFKFLKTNQLELDCIIKHSFK